MADTEVSPEKGKFISVNYKETTGNGEGTGEKHTLQGEEIKYKSDVKENTSSWKELFIVITVLNILLLLFGVAIIWVWRHEVKNLSLKQTNNFCLPCDKIRVHKNDDWFNFKMFNIPKQQENGTEICCTDSESNLDKLVELFVDRHYRKQRAIEPLMNGCVGKIYHSEFKKPVVKLAGITQIVKDQQTSVVHWDQTNSQSYIGPADKVTYNDGRITIGYGAYYYVYSQITFSEMKTSTDKYHSLAIHSIHHKRKHARSERPIINSSDAKCQLQEETSNSTSHIGAVVYLEAGDEIGVRVLHGNTITRSPYSNFFGFHTI